MLGLFATHAWQTHQRAVSLAEDRQRRHAAVLADHVTRVFDAQAATIELAIHKLAGHADDPGEELSRWFTERARNDPVVGAMLVVGFDGQAIASNLPADGIRYDDRDYFRSALAGSGIHVGPQIKGRALMGEPVFTLAQRWQGGVVVISLRTAVLETLFAQTMADDLAQGVVALYRADGVQLARAPALTQPINLRPDTPGLMQHVPAREGTYRIHPLVGGGERLYAFRQVEGYPVWVTCGVSLAAIRSEWLAGLLPSALVALLALTLLTGAYAVARRRERASSVALAHVHAQARDALFDREAALAVAERANLAKSHFLGAASHDLRQPIQGVRLFLDVLGGRLADPVDRAVLGKAVNALEGAEALLSTLRDVSILEAGLVPAAPCPVRLESLMAELVKEFEGLAAARGLVLIAVPSTLTVYTDPVLLARMLRNLLSNALRYTPQGRVLLGCRRRGRNAVIEVWDTGQGIPEDKLDIVFEDFVQIGNPERDRSKGLGLGLALVRRMAALLGHQVSVRSRLGRGTVFSIQVPLANTHSLR